MRGRSVASATARTWASMPGLRTAGCSTASTISAPSTPRSAASTVSSMVWSVSLLDDPAMSGTSTAARTARHSADLLVVVEHRALAGGARRPPGRHCRGRRANGPVRPPRRGRARPSSSNGVTMAVSTVPNRAISRTLVAPVVILEPYQPAPLRPPSLLLPEGHVSGARRAGGPALRAPETGGCRLGQATPARSGRDLVLHGELVVLGAGVDPVLELDDAELVELGGAASRRRRRAGRASCSSGTILVNSICWKSCALGDAITSWMVSLTGRPMRSQTSCCRKRSRMRTAASKANSWRSRSSAVVSSCVVLLER